MKEKIYIENIIGILKEIADRSYQERAWANPEAIPSDMTISFVEAANGLFDDCIIGDLLEGSEIIISKEVTKVLQKLSDVIDDIDEYRSEEEIINDPLMEIVRQEAAKTLELIKESDGLESTVRFVKVGTVDTPISIREVFS